MAQGWVTFYSAYEDGLSAQKRGDHAGAVRAFSQAIALQPRPGEHLKTYGLNFLATYHPYLRVAECRMALLDLPGAEAALKQSQAMGLEPAQEREGLWVRLHMLQAAVPAPPQAKVPSPEPSPVKAPEPAPEATAVPAPAPLVQPADPGASSPKPLPAGHEPQASVALHPSVPDVAQGPGKAARVVEPSMARSAPLQAPSSRMPWALGGALALLGLGVIWKLGARQGRRVPEEVPVPASQDTWVDDANVGRRFGGYTVKRRISAGGCATAYLGVEESTGLEVAIKVPHPHLLSNPDFLTRFRREAALGRMLDHPRIARTLKIAPEGSSPWIALAFIHGIPLQVLLQREGALTVPRSLALAADMAQALAHAHSKGIVHRDLKPGNVMVTSKGAVVLDFGIARVLDSSMTQTSQFMGTPAYAAPEALDSSKAGPAADRYALGMILFEMLAGRRAFAGLDGFDLLEAHRYQALPDLTALRPDLPADLWRLIQRLCAKAPETRPEDGETLNILEKLRGEWPEP